MMLLKSLNWFKKSTLGKILLVVFLFSLNPSFANNDAIKSLNLIVDHGTPLRLQEPAATIAIGNPDFFNIVTLENNLLMLTGVKDGTTSLTVIGKSGQIYQYRVQVTVDIQKIKDDMQRLQAVADIGTQRLKNIIQQMEPNVYVENMDGKIILSGEVNSGAALIRVLTLADRFMGGKAAEPDFKVISDYGGILAGNLDEKINQLDPTSFNELAFSGGGGRGGAGGGGGRGGAGGGFGVTQQTLLEDKANLAQNISRASVISVANGKVISLIKVASIPKVEIQMRIVEVDRSKTDQFGIDWRLDGNNVSIGSLHGNVVSSIASPFSLFDGDNSGNVNTGDANLVGFFKPGKYALSAFIKAIEQKGATSTLSEPLLTAISGESARFLVGGSVPIPTQTLAAGNATSNAISVTNVRYLQFGLHITVRPTVLENGKISIVLDQSISEADYSNAIQILGASTPGFKQKAVSTITESENGETWAVAGLLTEEDRKSLQSVPWISKVPIIGKLFETKDDSTTRNELIILVTARRVDTPNSTTTNFNGRGKLSPKPIQDNGTDPTYLKNNDEMSSNHLPLPSKAEPTPSNTEDSEKPINLNKNQKEKNNLSAPIGKSKKLALRQSNLTDIEGQSVSNQIKIVHLKEKSSPSASESVPVKVESPNTNGNQVAQTFSFDTDKLIKEIIEKKSSAHVVNMAPDKTNTAHNEQEATSNNNSSTNEVKLEEKKPTTKIINVADLHRENTSLESKQSSTYTPTPKVSAENKTGIHFDQQTKVESDYQGLSSASQNQIKPLPNESDIKADLFSEKNKQANVIVINFLSAHEKNEYFKNALKKGLANVPPKSQWVDWKVGVGAIDGDVKNLIQFAVSPNMRGQIYSGASIYVDLPKSHANYALD